ncbi:LPD29 domain-containing protein, partial [Burkholderia cenocepacia]
LREGFPATSFAVRVAKNERGTQLTIDWTDGPRDVQVARLVMPLQATRLADGGRLERVEHFMLTSSGRRTVRLAADRIALSRQFSDRAVERVLTRLASRYGDRLA